MTVKIITKAGSWFEVEGFYEGILAHINIANDGDYMEFTRLDGGFPKPKVSVRVDSIEQIQQVNK